MRPQQLGLARSARTLALCALASDIMVYAFVLSIGVFQLTHYPHATDFLSDVTYPDLARSLLQHGSYEVRLLPETTLPPGLPLVLAFVGKFFGLSPPVAFSVIAVSTTLGLIAVYHLLRRVEGRGVAAIACLLLGSSPALFAFNTVVIFPEMPYLFVSMVALLLALKIDHARRGPRLIVWVLLLSVALVLAVLIRSVGIALLLGLVTWIVASFVLAPETRRRRMRRFLIPLTLGLAAQLSWSIWAQRHETPEWQLPGYPGSYTSQLKVKNGQYPELGLAHVSDIPGRVGRNIVAREAGSSQLLLRRTIGKFWSSPAIAGLIVVMAVGLASSLRNGGQLYDWYFLWYEFIFMLWPWDSKDRFLFPVVPLTCLYLWRGGKVIKDSLIRHPRSTALIFALLGSVLCICSATFALRLAAFPVNPEHIRGDHLQTIAATFFWGMFAIVAFMMLKLQPKDGGASFAHIAKVVKPGLFLSFVLLGALVVSVLVGTGIRKIVAEGRENVKLDMTKQSFYPEIEASDWIRTHEPSNLVIMAREPEFVFHYTHQPTVWFPPISDPTVLMDGIRRHHIGLVEVAHHANSYWLPPEDVCFQDLLRTYSSAFHLSHEGPDYWVYEVVLRPTEPIVHTPHERQSLVSRTSSPM
jgi:hypothetical protein